MKWFKFYGQDWLTDLKIMEMSMEDRLCYLTLLCLASQTNGTIKGCTEEAIIKLSNIPNDPTAEYNPHENAQGCLKRFEELEMITNDNKNKLHTVTLTHFAERQGTNLTNYERVKKHREKKKALIYNDNKQLHNVINDNNTAVIKDNPKSDKNRTDINIVETSSTDFDFKSYLKELENHKARHINVIGHYFEEKGLTFPTRAQANAALKRHMKAAKEVAVFDDDKIVKATNEAKKQYPDLWTVETVLKILTR